MTPTLVPYPYQKQGVRFIERKAGRALVGDEPGLGKTPQALWWIKNYTHPADGPAVVVCPANVKYHWQNEALRFVGLESQVLSGKEVQIGVPEYPAPIYIINYDILQDWMPFLAGLKPQTLIIDEIQRVKNRRAKRTNATKYLSRLCKHVIGLSGTPIVNRPAEFWPGLNMIRPDLFPSFFSFGRRYCGARRQPWGWEYKGATHTKELNQFLRKELMVRRKQADVLGDLPALTRAVLPVDLPDYREYKQAHEDFITWLRKKNWDRADRAEKAERLVKYGYLKRLVGELKLPVVCDWLDNFFEESRGKIITFAVHHNVLNPLHDRYRMKSVLVTGKVGEQKRREFQARFNQDPKCRNFLGQLQATCEGWPGQAANDVLFAELGWVPGEHSQAEKRPHRIGQKNPVRAWYLVAKGTIEETLLEVIQTKQQVLDKVLDGGVRDDSINVFDLMTQKLLGR